ncbi:MAG: crossover junction endodeoxyribonuclease RuvC [Pygmaiobacter sp.]
MRILGIDPGYAIVGYGVVDYDKGRFRTVDYGAITTEAHTLFESRLVSVYDEMLELIERTKPEVLAIETLFFTTNQKTVIYVAEARGVILLAATKCGLPVYEYSPMQVKQAVAGYGKAVKKQVQEMTRVLLKLQSVPKPDDTADALAMAICHAHSSRSQLFGKTGSVNVYNLRASVQAGKPNK